MVEVVRAMNYLIDQGFAYYWGTSEWSAQMIEEAKGIAKEAGPMMAPPIFEQVSYSMLMRERVEMEHRRYAPLTCGPLIPTMQPLALQNGVGLPLAVCMNLTSHVHRQALPTTRADCLCAVARWASYWEVFLRSINLASRMATCGPRRRTDGVNRDRREAETNCREARLFRGTTGMVFFTIALYIY
jgi:hypothetical protein